MLSPSVQAPGSALSKTESPASWSSFNTSIEGLPMPTRATSPGVSVGVSFLQGKVVFTAANSGGPRTFDVFTWSFVLSFPS